MCGRFVTPEIAAMERFWHVGGRNWHQFILPTFNVAPTTQVPILLKDQNGEWEVRSARWGLIPSWWKKPEPPSMTFNARSEEAAGKPTWRDAMKGRRCLMPMRGWYEWQVVPGAKTKQPYFVSVPGEDVLAVAALWSTWKGPDGASVLSCALLSKEAAPSIAHIHHRMPVVLKPEHYDAWVDSTAKPEAVQAMITDARIDLSGYPVSTRVNQVRNNSPELLQSAI